MQFLMAKKKRFGECNGDKCYCTVTRHQLLFRAMCKNASHDFSKPKFGITEES